MTGKFVDTLYYSYPRKYHRQTENIYFLETDYGKIRSLDTRGNMPVIINVPDGPNVIEHQLPLIEKLSKTFRVICFEYPGLGYSYPSGKFNYSFDEGSKLLFQIMHILEIPVASLLFSCSNGFYALNAARLKPDGFNHIFLSQTPSVKSMISWTKKSIPDLLKVPVIGQLSNVLMDKKLANVWYHYALPRESADRETFRATARQSLNNGGCFCLSSLVQCLIKESENKLEVDFNKVTLVWGGRDFTHRKTQKETLQEHVSSCEIIEFEDSGHFPELEKPHDYVRLVRERVNY